MITTKAAQVFIAATTTAVVGGVATGAAFAADKTVKIGIDLSLTGADSQGAARVKDGIMMAFDAANQGNAVPGYKFDVLVTDDGTATSGQYDPAQAATNARKMVSDKSTVAAIGPLNSGSGKAMAPILSQGGLATITPSSTNPDITDPKFAAQYRPAGKAIYFRTVATDAFQGPYMANYYADVLQVKSVFVLDDSGAYGVGIADAFQGQADKKSVKIIGRDRLDPKAADYSSVLTKIKSLNPNSIYYGGDMQAGVKLAKQAYDIVPKMTKGGGDGMMGPELLTAAGFPASEGWYTTNASPHLTDEAKAAELGEVVQDESTMLIRTTTPSPPTTRQWSSSMRSNGSPTGQAATRESGARRHPVRPRCRPSRDRYRSMPTATWRTRRSACSRSRTTRSPEDLSAVSLPEVAPRPDDGLMVSARHWRGHKRAS